MDVGVQADIMAPMPLRISMCTLPQAEYVYAEGPQPLGRWVILVGHPGAQLSQQQHRHTVQGWTALAKLTWPTPPAWPEAAPGLPQHFALCKDNTQHKLN